MLNVRRKLNGKNIKFNLIVTIVFYHCIITDYYCIITMYTDVDHHNFLSTLNSNMFSPTSNATICRAYSEYFTFFKFSPRHQLRHINVEEIKRSSRDKDTTCKQNIAR